MRCFPVLILGAVVAGAGCSSDDPAMDTIGRPTAGSDAAGDARGSSSGGASVGDTTAADPSTGAPTSTSAAGPTGSSSGAPDDGVVTFDEVQPIFADRCAPCHTGAAFGGHSVGGSDVAEGFAQSQLPADGLVCRGLTKGACTIVRIQSGEMPMGFGCSGDPAIDIDGPGCLTQAEQDQIQAWIDDGQLAPV